MNFYSSDKNDGTNDPEKWIQYYCKVNKKEYQNQAIAFDLFI